MHYSSFVTTAVHASTSPSRLRSARAGTETVPSERSVAESKDERGVFSTHRRLGYLYV